MTDPALSATQPLCRICGGPASAMYVAREMMFGRRDAFPYFQCGDCGCLQIADVPADLGRYYPNNYYSFNPGRKRVRPLRRFLRAARARFAVERKGLLGRVLFWQKKPDPLLVMYGDLGVKLTDRLLDVGGGGGGHVWQLREAGFTRALAIDRFIDRDVEVDGTILARKMDVFGIEGEFDIIAFHHSFEHMDRQRDTLVRCRALLARGGRVLIRVPTVTSEAWERYRENWVGVDAPRHLYLHSHESLRRLAAAAGFRIERLWCDSEILQFWGSEQYRRDIPLDDEKSYGRGLDKSIFTAEQIADFRRRAAQLNAEMRGDAICALMVPDGAGV